MICPVEGGSSDMDDMCPDSTTTPPACGGGSPAPTPPVGPTPTSAPTPTQAPTQAPPTPAPAGPGLCCHGGCGGGNCQGGWCGESQANCEGSCNGDFCPPPTPSPPPTHAPAPPTQAPCTDENQNCGNWAASGECEANPAYMLVNCPLSCGVCSPGALTQASIAPSLKNTKKHV